MTKLKCTKCKDDCYFVDITKSKDIKELFGCACDLCRNVFCRNCNHLTSSEIRVLCNTRNCLKFFCTDCVGLFNANVKDLPEMNGRIANLERETQELKRKVENNAPTYAQVVADTSVLKEQVEQLNVQITSQQNAPRVTASTENNISVEPTLLELAERERSAPNVLLFGIKENNSSLNEQDSDLDKTVNMLKRVKDNIQKDDIKIYRLGAPAQGKVRPIRIVTSSPSMAREILRNKARLNEENIYFKADQTPLQRTYLKAILSDLEERKQKGEMNIRVRYINNVPKIVFFQNEGRENSKN